ncbi:MAG: hypothetical protein EXR49_09240 [Dehalococcoidia bacterium]|nr:hypothetical protein [Dehalococcoidia bacterium]
MLLEALAGVRVLEWCQGIAGPYCGRLLAELGADVVKIEAPAGGDVARRWGPYRQGGAAEDVESSALFFACNVSKRGVTLRPDVPAGATIFRMLAGWANILLEDRPPGEMEGLGLGGAALRLAHPTLVVLSMTPFGQTGPYRGYKAYGVSAFHAGGEGYLQPGGPASRGQGHCPPVAPGGDVADTMTGVTGAAGAIAALLRARRTGRGDHIDLSQQEALMTISRTDLAVYPNQGVVERRDTRVLPIGGLFETADGYIEINPTEARMWEGLVEAMGRPAWSQEAEMLKQTPPFARAAEVREHIATWARQRRGREIEETLQHHACVAGEILTLPAVAGKRQLRERGFFAEIQDAGFGTFRLPSTPFGGGKPRYRPAPRLGEHTEQVLKELGVPDGEIVRLRKAGVL